MKAMTSAVSCCLWLAVMTATTDALIPGDSDEVRRLLNAIFNGGSIPVDMYLLANADTHQDPPPSSHFNIPDTDVSPTHPDPPPVAPTTTTTTTHTPVVDDFCPTTGPVCVSSCRGRASGDYQSCAGCHTYVTCSNGWMFPARNCPGGLVWDDMKKRCEWSSPTCVSCPPAGRASNFFVDLKEDVLGVGDEEIFKWAVKPPASPSNDDKCVRQGTLMVRPPACITEIRVLMEFSDPQGYTFHSSHLVFADGWAGFDGSGHYGMPGMELHTYDRNIYGFNMTQSGSEAVYQDNNTVSDMLYMSARDRGFVNNFAGVHKHTAKALSPTPDIFFVGINRVISPLDGVATRVGSGLCSLWISLIC